MAKKKKAAPKNPRTEVLVSLQESPRYLEQAGARVVAARLPQVAIERIALAAEDETELAPLGFDATWRHELQHEIETVKTKKVAHPDGRAPGDQGSHELEAAVAEANKWITRYHTVVKNSGPAVRKAAPKVTHNDHSPKVLAIELEKLASFIAAEARATERHGGGRAFATQAENLAQALSKARSQHKVARGSASEGVREVHAAVGVVYLELVRLSRAAHVALPRERAKAYTLEELHARTPQHPTATAEAADASASAAATTGS